MANREIILEHINEKGVLEKYELFFDLTTSLFDKNDKIRMTLPNKWSIILVFTETADAKDSTKMTFEGNNIIFTCNNWLNESWIENNKPYHIWNTDKSFHIYVKIKSSVLGQLRTVVVSVWKKND